jgi:hypothetical protein
MNLLAGRRRAGWGNMSGIHILYKFLFGFDKILILFDLATGHGRFRRKIFGNRTYWVLAAPLLASAGLRNARTWCRFALSVGLVKVVRHRKPFFDCGKRRVFRHLLLERRFLANEPFHAPRLPSRPFRIRARFSFGQRFSIPYNRDWFETCQMVTFSCPSTCSQST